MGENTFTPGPDTAKAFRDALGCFGTGVTVVTTQTSEGPLGMTANSFASVSLDPPLVLWCPARGSLRHDTFVRARHFAIHVLSAQQQHLARHFARTGDDFGQFDWSPGPQDVPHLTGCLARFECESAAVHDGGDHSIVVARVLRATHRAGTGLLFKQGLYGGFSGSG